MLVPRIAALIDAHCPPARAAVVRCLLSDECSLTLPLVTPESIQLIERIQAGVLRTTGWDPELITSRIRLAQTDWRDLLVAAGFATSVTAHVAWLEEAMRSGVLD